MKTFKINYSELVRPVFLGLLVILLLSSCRTTRYNTAASHQLVDPVCGMTVNKNTEFTDTYEGATYYFDSEDCLSVFKKNPGKFANSNRQYPRNSGMGAMHMGWWGPVLGAVMIVGMTTAMIIGLNH